MRFEGALFTGTLCILARKQMKNLFRTGKRSAVKTRIESVAVDAIEAEIAVARAHLASTIDELTLRTQPREILRRQKESVKAKFVDATHTPDGDLRVERLGALAAAGSAVLLMLAILHRRHHRGLF